MLLTKSELREMGERISQSKTRPVLVPTARNRARWPGMSEGAAGWLATDIGEPYGEDVAVENPRAGSSDMVSTAKVD